MEKVRDTEADIDRFADLIQKYTSFEELDSFMLNELIDRITIYETPDMGRYRKGKEKSSRFTTNSLVRFIRNSTPFASVG